jgi:hypothetical protein
MSLLQELGAQLRATSDELPTGLVTAAMERLRSATELLDWVRQTSVDPMGVPQLGNATEHAEHAAAALRLAQDAIAAYLTAVGLSAEGAQAPDRDWRAGREEQQKGDERGANPADRPDRSDRPDREPPSPEKLGPWWQRRVEQLTGEAPPHPDQIDSKPVAAEMRRRIDTGELMRRVAGRVRSGDRARLGHDLHEVDATTGLSLSAAAAPVLRRLSGDLLGHEPRPEDLGRLRTAVAARVRSLLPGIPAPVLEQILARLCRARVPEGSAHPADSAVTSSVLAGVLLARLGRDPSTLDPQASEPMPRRAAADA